jgi:probable F420-dependent oxidoreductase
MRAATLEAERLGADVISVGDHFFSARGDPNGRHLECWTLLAAIGEATERAELTALVTVASFRNPNLLADMARTLDHVTNGRAILGIGAGWMERDFVEYGYEFGTAGSRLRVLEDALPVVKRRWEKLNPPPVRRRIPILIGGSGEKVTLRIVAEHADIWNSISDVEETARKSDVLDEWCDRIGRDPAAIERSAVLNSEEQVLRAPDYVAAGITFLILPFGGPEFDLEPLAKLVEWRDRERAAPGGPASGALAQPDGEA